MIQYVLKKNVNEKMPNAYGKYFAYPVKAAPVLTKEALVLTKAIPVRRTTPAM